MAEDLLPILTRFHREILLPDMKRLVEESEQRIGTRFDDLSGHFDKTYQRLDRLESEYQMILVGLKRVEERLDKVEQRLDKVTLRSELLDLKARMTGLQEQVHALEARLGE